MPIFDNGDGGLYYEVSGAVGPKLVLVHGGMCNLRDWSNQVAELADDHIILALDLPSHGRSGGDPRNFTIPELARQVNALIDALEFASAVLVGHSLASRVVAEAAFQEPANAAAIILLDGSRSDGGLARMYPAEEGAQDRADLSLEEIIDLTIGPFAAPSVRQTILAEMTSAPAEVMSAAVDAMRVWDLERADLVFAGLPLGLNVLAVQSTYHDHHTPRRSLAEGDTTPYLDFLRAAHPRVESVILPRTGHFSMIERPARVSGLIREVAARSVRMT